MKVLVTPRSFGKTDPVVWDRLAAAGVEIVRNPGSSILEEAALADLLCDCDGVIIGVDPLTPAVLDAAPRLRAVAKYGVGLDNIPIDACAKRQIKVSRTTGANADAVADYAFALMLAVARRIIPIDQQCRKADWKKMTTIDVGGQTLGLLGLGSIGRKVAKRALGFSMRVLAYDVQWDEDFARLHKIEKADPDQIFLQSDFISLHMPLLPETRHIVGAPQLAAMKPTAVLINTARGGLIDESALLEALKTGQIYGAGLDVFEQEPPTDPDWYTLDNLVMGSHTAASTLGATEQMGRMAVDNILRDLSD